MRKPGGHPLLARLIDWTMAPMDPVRKRVIPQARGRVLEVGFGTGLNLPYYDFSAVEALTAIEPDPHMRARAEARRAELGCEVELIAAFAESLPFANASFDEVVVTFTLCTVANPERAIDEIRRVTRPGGRLRFAEHTASDHGSMRLVQRAVDPVWAHFAGGCHLDRDPVRLLQNRGFDVIDLVGHGRRPLNPTPVHRGVATR